MELEEGELPGSADDQYSKTNVDVSSKSSYELTLPRLDFSLDPTRPRQSEHLHKTARLFFKDQKNSLYERFKKKDLTGKSELSHSLPEPYSDNHSASMM